MRTKKEFCPTLEDIENEEIQRLAKLLRGSSEKETLSNILEWQDRNIKYWEERQAISQALLVLSCIMTVVTFLITWNIGVREFLIRSPYPHIISILGFLIGSMITYIVLLMPILWIYLLVVYRHMFHDLDFGFKKILKLAFIETMAKNLPVEKILEYKLAVCRDYAKLSAAILLNIYPEVYFITIPRHVATAIKIGEKLYILDKHLPILTLEKWLIKYKYLLKWNKPWHKHDYTIYVAKIEMNPQGNPINVVINKYPSNKHSQPKTGKIQEKIVEKSLKKLSKRLSVFFKIPPEEKIEKTNFKHEIFLRNFIVYLEDDEIVLESIFRLLKNKIESELCSKVSKISKIKLLQKDSDLIVHIYLS